MALGRLAAAALMVSLVLAGLGIFQTSWQSMLLETDLLQESFFGPNMAKLLMKSTATSLLAQDLPSPTLFLVRMTSLAVTLETSGLTLALYQSSCLNHLLRRFL